MHVCCVLQLNKYSHLLHVNGYIAKRGHMDCMFLSMEKKSICSASSLVKFVMVQSVSYKQRSLDDTGLVKDDCQERQMLSL